MSAGPHPGIALECDVLGRIERVINDSMGLERVFSPGVAFTACVSRDAFSKTLDFLTSARREGATYGWELPIETPQSIRIIHFAATATPFGVMIVGGNTDTELLTMAEEVMRMNNEQANALREAARRSARARSDDNTETSMFDEISRLNNELTAVQRQLARQNQELERTNEQMNRFLGMAAHDLRSPIVAIRSFTRFLLDDLGVSLTDEHREFLEVMHRSAAYMSDLVHDLLDVSVIESGRLTLMKEPVDLGELIRDQVNLHRPIAKRRSIEIGIQLPEQAIITDVDRTRLTQAVGNLIGNAIKFSPDGARVDVLIKQEDNKVRIDVTDSGPGIPEAEQHLLFNAFERTSVRPQGGEKNSGLGLAIAKRVVQEHGGELSVHSIPGQGSTFTITLPLAPNR